MTSDLKWGKWSGGKGRCKDLESPILQLNLNCFFKMCLLITLYVLTFLLLLVLRIDLI